MNPATTPLLNRITDRALRRFVQDWDALEALVVRVNRAEKQTTSDGREFTFLRRRLRRAYLQWESALRPHWPETVPSDPFRAMLSIESAADLVGNWQAMQTLPHARQAVNQLLLSMLEGVRTELVHRQVQGEGVLLHLVQAGPNDGIPVVLLHGFPEFWYGWRAQIDSLADAGYRVLIPDQRGYNRSDKPRLVEDYRPELLVADLLRLMQGLDLERVSLIGHDWGASVAWWAAYAHPDRFDRVVILNVPHPQVFARTLRADWRQRLRSWYIAWFQLPRLPELLLGAFGNAGLKSVLRRSSRRNTFSRQDLQVYQRAWSQPGAITGMLNWYRAVARYPARISTRGKLKPPTLIIWGARDIALSTRMARASLERCERGRLELIAQASHWVQHEAADQVNRLLLDFLAETSPTP